MKFSEEEKKLYEFPIEGTFDLANAALKLNVQTVLDIGCGSSGASLLFASGGCNVVAIGLDINSYSSHLEPFDKLGIIYHETLLEDF